MYWEKKNATLFSKIFFIKFFLDKGDFCSSQFNSYFPKEKNLSKFYIFQPLFFFQKDFWYFLMSISFQKLEIQGKSLKEKKLRVKFIGNIPQITMKNLIKVWLKKINGSFFTHIPKQNLLYQSPLSPSKSLKSSKLVTSLSLMLTRAREFFLAGFETKFSGSPTFSSQN